MPLKHKKTKNPNPKHRASLTEAQIRYIISKAKVGVLVNQDDSYIAYELISYLAPLLTKIENGSKKPDFIPATKPSHMSMLGELGEIAPAPAGIPKEERWSLAYAKMKLDIDSCSLLELTDAKEHMYLNGMMTREEEIAFEAGTSNDMLLSEVAKKKAEKAKADSKDQ